MAANKAGGNSKKIGRNMNKPWKKAYEASHRLERNKRLRAERIERQRKHRAERWARRLKKGKPFHGQARAMRRVHLQRAAA